jgi:hypothetical protein
MKGMVRARMQRIAGPVAGVLALACLAGLALRAGAAEQKDKKKLATLSGVIYRGDRQRPVADALIVLTTVRVTRDEDIPIRVEARSDAAGAYRFDDLIGAKYRVTIRTFHESAEQVPCKLRPARTGDPDSLVTVLEEDGKHVEQVLITHFPIKGGKTLVKDFDLQCQSVFARDEVRK